VHASTPCKPFWEKNYIHPHLFWVKSFEQAIHIKLGMQECIYSSNMKCCALPTSSTCIHLKTNKRKLVCASQSSTSNNYNFNPTIHNKALYNHPHPLAQALDFHYGYIHQCMYSIHVVQPLLNTTFIFKSHNQLLEIFL
jgi:hypothetical protein